MRKAHFLLLVAVIWTSAQAASEAPITIPNGYLTGSQFRAAGPAVQRGYAMGVVDGLLLSPMYGAPERRSRLLKTCLLALQLDSDQITALVSREIEADPVTWSNPAHSTAFRALRKACMSNGYAFD
jgi:hypothetical protein